MFRAVQPRQWGGLELDHATFYEGMVLIASACGSTGWVASVVGIHPWQVALFANEAQREVWGDEPDARRPRPWRPPVRSAGGRRIPNIRPLAFFQRHRSLRVGAAGSGRAGRGQRCRIPNLPCSALDFSIDHDSWKVTGLAGTGSKDVVVPGAFVPEHRTHSIVESIMDAILVSRSTIVRIFACPGGWSSATRSPHRRSGPRLAQWTPSSTKPHARVGLWRAASRAGPRGEPPTRARTDRDRYRANTAGRDLDGIAVDTRSRTDHPVRAPRSGAV